VLIFLWFYLSDAEYYFRWDLTLYPYSRHVSRGDLM